MSTLQAFIHRIADKTCSRKPAYGILHKPAPIPAGMTICPARTQGGDRKMLGVRIKLRIGA
jgi:hypothetical protein